MLTHAPLKNFAGLLLCGDKRTLEALHEVIHDVNARSPVVANKEGIFLGLAYDVRKAFEGQRRTIKPPTHEKEVGPSFGVEILWPVILFQSRMLRIALGHMPSGTRHQAMTYLLEHVIEQALDDQFDEQSPAIKAAWRDLDPFARDMEAVLDSRGALFCAWSKARRRSSLKMLIDTMSPRYPMRYEWMDASTRARHIDPQEFVQWLDREWVDPKW